MSKITQFGLLSAFSLCVGFSVGYHQGTGEERRSWEATAVYPDTLDGFPVCYKNPHFRSVFEISGNGITRINVPDPRLYPKHEHASPIIELH